VVAVDVGEVGMGGVGGEVGQDMARGDKLEARRGGGTEAERARNMVQVRARWPEQPQSRQRTGSRHLRTQCFGERQR
jgi:hypothetical protein